MKNNYTTVTFNNKQYIVAFTNKNEPFVFDNDILDIIPTSFLYKHINGYIYCRHNTNIHPIALHHIVKPYNKISVDHINQIKTDNRRLNLRYATQSEQNKNQSKRKRNVVLPENCDIDSQEIPTFIWYIKANGNHSDRWMVEIKDKYNWKTTSSKELSTRDKFELAKKHLRELIENRPELIEGHCINGELNNDAEKLKQEYINILKCAGVDYSKKIQVNLLENTHNNLDELLVDNQDKTKEKAQPLGMTFNIPMYCYYVKKTDTKGDAFCVGRLHPKQKENNKDWTTTKSVKISIQEKYNQMMAYLNNKEYNVKKDVPLVPKVKKEVKEMELSNEEYITIFKLKNQKNITTGDASDIFKKQFDKYIRRDYISKIWNSKVDVPE